MPDGNTAIGGGPETLALAQNDISAGPLPGIFAIKGGTFHGVMDC